MSSMTNSLSSVTTINTVTNTANTITTSRSSSSSWSAALYSSDWSTDNWTSSSSSSSLFFDASCSGCESSDQRIERSMEVFFFSSLISVVVGLTGNLLSIAVFSSKDMQSMSSNVYLLMLASSDSLYLISIFLSRTLTTIRCWYFPATTMDIANRSSFACILFQYLVDLFSDYSTFLILLFTVERGVAVFLPIKFKELFSVCRARISCLALFLFIAVVIAPHHALFMDVYDEYQVCTVKVNYEDIFAILYVVEMIIFRVLPVLLIALLNVLIIVRVTRLMQAKARRRQLTISSCHEGSGGGGGGGAGQGLTSSSSASVSKASSVAVKRRSKAQERNFQLTVILILVSSSYVLLYIPVLIHFVLNKLNRSLIIDLNSSLLDVFGNIARALYVSGFAINFFLYTVSGQVFRDQLTAIVCRCLRMRQTKKRAAGTPWTQTTSAAQEASSAF